MNKSIYLLVDTSGSMEGTGMTSLNEAIESILSTIQEAQKIFDTLNIQISVARFGDDAVWLTPTPEPINNYKWQSCQAEGLTAMGAAFDLLHNRLQEEVSAGDYDKPLILIISDGGPTDDYEPALERLNSLPHFTAATRIAIEIGNDADRDTLRSFTDSDNMIFTSDKIYNIVSVIENYFTF